MSKAPLMPMATAVWLVENTSLTFRQIAEFCKLHEVEVQGIADGEVAKGIVGYNPIISGQLTNEEIKLSSIDENRPLNIIHDEVKIKTDENKIKKYVPLSKRQDKPDSALWLIKNHNILKDSQIAKLVGVTKNSVTSIRNKSYWNYNNGGTCYVFNPSDYIAYLTGTKTLVWLALGCESSKLIYRVSLASGFNNDLVTLVQAPLNHSH